jgi:N-dimethylarginine dimethylaminohydrolase
MIRAALPGPRHCWGQHGLTTVDLGVPSFDTALEQHSRYCKALEQCGLTLTTLAADLRHPDSTFVEDTAVLGLSLRTNEEGVRQLAAHLAAQGYTSSVIDVRGMTSILHLKSGISYIGNNTMVAMDEMAGNPLFRNYKLIRVSAEESYAANCVRVNDRVLVPAGYPHLIAQLADRGFNPLPLDMSEFRKMDGGLSCLSLRF